MEQLETMAINTAVSEAVDEVLDSAINTAVSEVLDSPTLSDDLVLVSDEEEEGHEDRCEWGFIYCVFLTWFLILTVCTNDQNCFLLLQ